jgi:hypothetical protein
MVLPTTSFRNHQRQQKIPTRCVRKTTSLILFLLIGLLVSIVYLFIRSLSLNSGDSGDINDLSSWSSKKSTEPLSFNAVKAGGKKIKSITNSGSTFENKKDEALRRRPPGLRTRGESLFKRDKQDESSSIYDPLVESMSNTNSIDTRKLNQEKSKEEQVDDRSSSTSALSSTQRVVSSSKDLVDELRLEQQQQRRRRDDVKKRVEEDEPISSASIPLYSNKDNAQQVKKTPIVVSDSLPLARTASAAASTSSSSTNAGQTTERVMKTWPILEHLASLLTVGSLDDRKLRIGFSSSESVIPNKESSSENENEEGDENEEEDVLGTDETETQLRSISRQQTRRDFIKEIFGVSSFITSTSKSTSNSQSSSSSKNQQRHRAASQSTLSGLDGGKSLINGINGPILTSTLRNTYVNDGTSKALLDALLLETVSANIAEIRSPCFVQPITINPVYVSVVPTTTPLPPISLSSNGVVGKQTGNEKSTGRVINGGTITTASTLNAALNAASNVASNVATSTLNSDTAETTNPSTVNDQIRLIVSRLAEIDYRSSVALLVSQMTGIEQSIQASSTIETINEKTPSSNPPNLQSASFENRRGVVGSGGNQMSSGGVSRSAPLTVSSNTQLPSTPLVSLSAEHLPPRPFIAHDGRLDLSRGRPVFVVGAGPGLFSLRLASTFRNTSILSLSWPTRSMDDQSTVESASATNMPGFFSTVDTHTLLKAELGADIAGSSWILDAVVDPSPSRARTLSSHTRSLLFADPKSGGLLPAAFIAKSKGSGKKRDCIGGICQDGGEKGGETQENTLGPQEGNSREDVKSQQPKYDLSRDISPLVLRRLARFLSGNTGNRINSGIDEEGDVSSINFDLLVLSDIGLLISQESEFGRNDASGTGVMLPFEFEKLLGGLLTLSRVTFVSTSASGNDIRGLPQLPFFDYWPSLEALVRASVEAVGMVPTIRSVGSSSQRSNSEDSLGVLVSVQTPAEALYESSLYEQARILAASMSNTRGSSAQKDVVIPSAPGLTLGKRAVPGYILNFCPDPRPRARRGAVHPSGAWGEFGRGVPLTFVQDFGLSAADASSLAAQVATADLPTRHLMPLTLSSRQGGGRIQGNVQPWVIVGSKLLLATDSKPARHEKEKETTTTTVPIDEEILSSSTISTISEKESAKNKEGTNKNKAPFQQKKSNLNRKSISETRKESSSKIEPKSTIKQSEELSENENDSPQPVLSTKSIKLKSTIKSNVVDSKDIDDISKTSSITTASKQEDEQNADKIQNNNKPVSVSRRMGVAKPVLAQADESLQDIKKKKKTTTTLTDNRVLKETAKEDETEPSTTTPLDTPSSSMFSRKKSPSSSLLLESNNENIEENSEETTSESMKSSKSNVIKSKLADKSTTIDNTVFDDSAAKQAEEEAQEALKAAEEASSRAKKLRARAAEKALQDSILNAIEDDSRTSSLTPDSSTDSSTDSLTTATEDKSQDESVSINDTEDIDVSKEELALLSAASKSSSEDTEDDAILLRKGRLLLEEEKTQGKKKSLPSLSSMFSRKASSSTSISSDSPVEIGEDVDSGPLLPHLIDTRWANIRPLRAPSSPPSRPVSFDQNVRISEAREQSALVTRETASFKAWWKVLRAETLRAIGSTIAPKDETYSILIQGTAISLLTAKIARVHPLTTILSVVTDSGSSPGLSVFGAGGSVDSHNDLMRLIGARNNFVVSPLAHSKSPIAGTGGGGITPDVARQLAAADDPIRYAAYVGCSSVWVNRLASSALSIISTSSASSSRLSTQNIEKEAVRIADLIAVSWEEQVGEMIRIAGSSFIELPPFIRLLGPLLVLAPQKRCVMPSSGEVIPCAFTPSKETITSNTRNDKTGVEEEGEEDGEGSVSDIDIESEEWRRRIELALFRDESGTEEEEDQEDGLTSATSNSVSTSTILSTSLSLFSRKNTVSDKINVKESSLAAVYEILKAYDQSSKPFRSSKTLSLSSLALTSKVVSILSERYSPKNEKTTSSSSSSSTSFDGFSRSYEPFRRLFLSAALRSGLTEPEARFIATNREPSTSGEKVQPESTLGLPLVILRVDVKPWAQLQTSIEDNNNEKTRVGVSLHTLLTIGAPSALRARLLRLHLALPITAIARAAVTRGISLQGLNDCKSSSGGPNDSKKCETLAISPTDLRLVPSAMFPTQISSSSESTDDNQSPLEACAFELVYTLPGKPRATFHSSLCLVDPLASFTIDGEPSSIDLAADSSGNTITRTSLDLNDSNSGIIESWAAVASQLTPLDTATGNAQAGRF